MQPDNTTSAPLIPPTLPESPPDPTRTTRGQGIGGFALLACTGLLIAVPATALVVTVAPGGMAAAIGGAVFALLLAAVWLVAALVTLAAGGAARLSWVSRALPLAALVVCAAGVYLWVTFAVSTDAERYAFCAWVGICVAATATWLVVAGIRHLRASGRPTSPPSP